MNYYRLLDDLHSLKDRWFLGELNLQDPFDFWKYIRVNLAIDNITQDNDLAVDVREKGRSLDFTFADFDIPIVNNKVVSLIHSANVDFIPVQVNNVEGKYYILVVKKEIECIDENNSEFMKFDSKDEVRPDKAGQYRSFKKMVIHPDIVNGEDIFRIKKFNSALIVSERIKDNFQIHGITGVKFLPVVGV